MRGRKKGYDNKKISAIVVCLIRNPDGLWLNRIAKETGLHHSTVTKYIDTILSPLVDNITLGESETKPLLRVVKLRPVVIEKLQEGQNIGQILRLLSIMKKLE